MYIMCLFIFEEKAEIQEQYPLSLNPVQKADDPESESFEIHDTNFFNSCRYLLDLGCNQNSHV